MKKILLIIIFIIGGLISMRIASNYLKNQRYLREQNHGLTVNLSQYGDEFTLPSRIIPSNQNGYFTILSMENNFMEMEQLKSKREGYLEAQEPIPSELIDKITGRKNWDLFQELIHIPSIQNPVFYDVDSISLIYFLDKENANAMFTKPVMDEIQVVNTLYHYAMQQGDYRTASTLIRNMLSLSQKGLVSYDLSFNKTPFVFIHQSANILLEDMMQRVPREDFDDMLEEIVEEIVSIERIKSGTAFLLVEGVLELEPLRYDDRGVRASFLDTVLSPQIRSNWDFYLQPDKVITLYQDQIRENRRFLSRGCLEGNEVLSVLGDIELPSDFEMAGLIELETSIYLENHVGMSFANMTIQSEIKYLENVLTEICKTQSLIGDYVSIR